MAITPAAASTAATFQPQNEDVTAPLFPYEVTATILAYACDFETDPAFIDASRNNSAARQIAKMGRGLGLETCSGLFERVVLAQQEDSVDLPTESSHARYLQATRDRKDKPLLSHYAIILIDSYCEKTTLENYGLMYNRLQYICHAVGVLYSSSLKANAFVNARSEESSLTGDEMYPAHGEPLFRHYDLSLSNCARLGKPLPAALTVFKRIRSQCSSFNFTLGSPGSSNKLGTRVLWSASDYDLNEEVEVNSSALGALTLFLKHYPDQSIRLDSEHPLGPKEFSKLVLPDFDDMQTRGDSFTVFNHDPTASRVITFTRSHLRSRFLGRPLVTAILDSGKRLSREDLIQALFVELANNVYEPDGSYVARLLEASADARFLGSPNPWDTDYFYLDDPRRTGGPILFMAYEHMLRAYSNYLLDLSAEEIQEKIQFYEENVLSHFLLHGASYTPIDLRYRSAPGKIETPNIVDYLIAHEFFGPTRIASIKRWICERNVLPNSLSLSKLLFFRTSRNTSLIDDIVTRAPHLLKEIVDDSDLLDRMIRTETFPIFQAHCKNHQVAFLPSLQGVFMRMISKGVINEFIPDGVEGIKVNDSIWITLPDFGPFKQASFKVDLASQEVAEGFLKIVRGAVGRSKTPEGTREILLGLLKLLQKENLLDSPKDLVAAALDFAERSRYYTTLCLLLRNLLQDLGGAASAATTAAAAAVAPTNYFGSL
jgi:hypothetical protein